MRSKIITMRKSKTEPINQLIQSYIQSLGIERPLLESRLVLSWEEVTGKYIAGQTKNLYIKNRVLFAQIQSSLVKRELSLIKEGLLFRLNEPFDRPIIDDIKFY